MNNDKAYYETEDFWSTAPEDAQAFLDERYFVKWIGDHEFWWDTFPESEECGYWDEPHSLPWPKERFQNNESFSLIERPTLHKKETNDVQQPWIPSVGEVVERIWTTGGWGILPEYKAVKILAYDGADVIYRWIEEGSVHARCFERLDKYGEPIFRPLPKQKTIQEKMLDKWQRQSLDYSHDTTSSQYTLGSVFDFVVKNFNVEDKKES